jgi:hypothetical protein
LNRLMMKLMGHTLMNEAPADGAPSGGAPAAPASAPAPAAAPAPESTLLTPPAAPVTTDPKPEGELPAKPGEPAKPEVGKPNSEQQGAPEAYTDFTLPEGMDMDVEVLGEFKDFAKELNLPQDKAQKIVDFQTKLATKQAEQYQAAVMKQGEQWAAAVKNDPELGGENYEKSVASAVKVIQAFGDDGLKSLLNTSGLGNHPALFKFCHRVSQAISEDKFVLPGSQTNAPKEMTIVDAFR